MIKSPYLINDTPVIQSAWLEDDQVVVCKNPHQIFMGQLAYLHSVWQFGGTINDFIEWRCAHYSKQIDKKHYLR